MNHVFRGEKVSLLLVCFSKVMNSEHDESKVWALNAGISDLFYYGLMQRFYCIFCV